MIAFLLLGAACQEASRRTPRALDDTAAPEGPMPPAAVGAAVGGGSVCVLQVGGKVFCWGRDLEGVEDPSETFASIDGGGFGFCGCTSRGAFECWGSEPLWEGLPRTRISDYDVGDHALCVLDDAGFATCVGDEYWTYPSPATIPGDRPFTRIGASIDGACVLGPDGAIECYVNGWGDWGLGPPAGTFVDIAIGWDEGCGLTETGGAVCWGLGTAAPGTRFRQMSAGPSYACGLTDNEAIACWPEWTSTPAEYTSEWYADKVTSSFPRTGSFVSIDSSAAVSVAVTTDGQVVIFGDWDQETYAEAWFAAHPEE